MGEFSAGVLEEELADENEGDSEHIDGQESHVGEDGCLWRIAELGQN